MEATAFALQALITVDPDDDLVEPAVDWLMRNRRSVAWDNTRATAVAILALNDLLRIRGRQATDLEYELSVNGHIVSRRKITAGEQLSAQTRFLVDPGIVRASDNEVRVRRLSGAGDLFVTAEASYFSLDHPIVARGADLTVKREYFRLAASPTLLKGLVTDRTLLGKGDALWSGEHVEVVLTIAAEHDHRYLVFEDLKPAGLEALERRSGVWQLQRIEPRAARLPGSAMPTRSVYRELGDRRIGFLVEHLPAGIWELRYELRAEMPGRYSALPVVGRSMYVPDIGCNSDETELRIEPRIPSQVSRN